MSKRSRSIGAHWEYLKITGEAGHPNVKLSLDNLAKLYRATDRPSVAEEVGQRMARLQAQ